MATIRINMHAKRPKEGTDFEMLEKVSPLAASITKTMLDTKHRSRKKQDLLDLLDLRERMQNWCHRYHRLLVGATLDELRALLKDCPDASSIEAVALKMRIDAEAGGCEPGELQPSKSSLPPISRPG